MGKHPVTGVDTIDRFKKLIKKGRVVRDKYSNTYFHYNETNDFDGQRVAKIFDNVIHDQDKELTRYKTGHNWTRGGYGR